MLSSTRTTTSGGLTVTGSNDAVFSRVTGSEDASWRRRISGGSDDVSVGRSSLSSISSTDDIKMDATATSSDGAKNELNLGNAVGSSSEADRKPPVSQDVQENSLESSTGCVTKEDTSKDKTAHVGSSGVVEGSGATSTTQTTPGGKKKVIVLQLLQVLSFRFRFDKGKCCHAGFSPECKRDCLEYVYLREYQLTSYIWQSPCQYNNI